MSNGDNGVPNGTADAAGEWSLESDIYPIYNRATCDGIAKDNAGEFYLENSLQRVIPQEWYLEGDLLKVLSQECSLTNILSILLSREYSISLYREYPISEMVNLIISL